MRDIQSRVNAPIGQAASSAWAQGGLAAALSTADGLLLTIANALSHDLYYKMIDPNASTARRVAISKALLLVVDTPVPIESLASVTEQPPHRIAECLQRLGDDLALRDSGIDLREAGGGWRLYTRARFAPYVERLLLDGARSKLTRAALETLAVVAYRQPVTRARVSAVRGVNVDAVMRTLLARARGDDAYPALLDRYRDMATSLALEGHIAWAEKLVEY